MYRRTEKFMAGQGLGGSEDTGGGEGGRMGINDTRFWRMNVWNRKEGFGE